MSPDLEAHEKFLKHQFTRLRGVAHIQTAFSLSSLESVPSVPLAQPVHSTNAGRRGSRR